MTQVITIVEGDTQTHTFPGDEYSLHSTTPGDLLFVVGPGDKIEWQQTLKNGKKPKIKVTVTDPVGGNPAGAGTV